MIAVGKEVIDRRRRHIRLLGDRVDANLVRVARLQNSFRGIENGFEPLAAALLSRTADGCLARFAEFAGRRSTLFAQRGPDC